MSRFTMAEVKNEKLEGWNAPERFRVYALKVDGEAKGKLLWRSRPKNAGGPSWCVEYPAQHGMTAVFFGSKAACLDHFKSQF